MSHSILKRLLPGDLVASIWEGERDQKEVGEELGWAKLLEAEGLSLRRAWVSSPEWKRRKLAFSCLYITDDSCEHRHQALSQSLPQVK